MEKTALPKLMLNKKVISKLENQQGRLHVVGWESEDGRCSAECTFIECASIPMCRTNIYQSCAPCVPPPVGTAKGCNTKGS